MAEQDKHFQEAHKHITRGRHQFIMGLARQGYKEPEIKAIVTMIDWKLETELLADDFRQKEANPPPTAAPSASPANGPTVVIPPG